jgi:hypothetical protein
MALTYTDVAKSISDLSFDTVTINAAAVQDSAEIDFGASTFIGEITALFTVTGFAAAPAAGGYILLKVIPLSATSGTEYNDGPGGVVLPVTADALYDMPAILQRPPGCRYGKLRATNATSQNTDADAASLSAKWLAVTV